MQHLCSIVAYGNSCAINNSISQDQPKRGGNGPYSPPHLHTQGGSWYWYGGSCAINNSAPHRQWHFSQDQPTCKRGGQWAISPPHLHMQGGSAKYHTSGGRGRTSPEAVVRGIMPYYSTCMYTAVLGVTTLDLNTAGGHPGRKGVFSTQ